MSARYARPRSEELEAQRHLAVAARIRTQSPRLESLRVREPEQSAQANGNYAAPLPELDMAKPAGSTPEPEPEIAKATDSSQVQESTAGDSLNPQSLQTIRRQRLR